jgi:two-component system OmpR family sensor kinase
VRLRRRLVATMIILVVLGLAAVDIITLSSLHSYLYGRVDDQLANASQLVSRFVHHDDDRGHAVTPGALGSRVGPDIYVELIDADGTVVVARPSGTPSGNGADQVDPPPTLPRPLSQYTVAAAAHQIRSARPYGPSSTAVNVSSDGGHGPAYRLEATSLPGQTLVLATTLTTVNATLNSLRNIELALSLGLLAALVILMTLLIRQGLRPLEEMARQADAIAAGDLSRRVQPSDGNGEIARLGRALNGMLSQIETAFSQRALSEERLRSFLADASHELRTPLTSIRGYAELLRKDALGDEASRDRALSRIEKEAARMGALVGDLGVLARQGDGPQPILGRVDLAAVAADVVADARIITGDRPIEMTSTGEVPVAGDAARIEQMVHNLVGNALSHTPGGTPVEVGVSVRGESAVLRVRDQGPGMSPAQASRVFDRFYRGNGDSGDGGSGLGLFIVATLARSLGGEATVDTAPGQGATFEVRLPLYSAGGAGPQAGGAGAAAGGSTAAGGDGAGQTSRGGGAGDAVLN